jgi:hypothetical protein
LLATRRSDSKTLAIEHTIVEPFVRDKEDFADFSAAFLAIENDRSLAVQGRWLQIFVPAGALRKQPPETREAMVRSVKTWIEANRLTLPFGRGVYTCSMTGTSGKPALDISLNVKVAPLKHGDTYQPGVLHVRRQQMEINLGAVVEKALKKKLAKLINTKSNIHILLLERQHMNLLPEMILEEIDKCRASFPGLNRVDEIWFVETIFYGTTFGGTYLRFERYGKNDEVVQSYDFNEGKLISECEDGWHKKMSCPSPNSPHKWDL